MGNEITIFINDMEVVCREGMSILEAADDAEIYIPRLCYHPDLPPGPGTKTDSMVYRHEAIYGDRTATQPTYQGCNICLVEIEGKGIVRSCSTIVEDRIIVHTNTTKVKELRRDNLARILSIHPHSCMLCSEKDGCDREECTEGEDIEGRCCPNFDSCEFQMLCEYVTIKDSTPQYVPKKIPKVDTPFFTVDPNLCIGCTRCIRACETIQNKKVIGFTYKNAEFVLGTIKPSYRESGCVFCGACVGVCPSGALTDKGQSRKKKEELKLTPIILPPEDICKITDDTVQMVPELNGVYRLYNNEKRILYIHGTENLRDDLLEKLKTVENARYFRYEVHAMYTMRENELLEKHLKKYGSLPEVNNEISDLY